MESAVSTNDMMMSERNGLRVPSPSTSAATASNRDDRAVSTDATEATAEMSRRGLDGTAAATSAEDQLVTYVCDEATNEEQKEASMLRHENMRRE